MSRDVDNYYRAVGTYRDNTLDEYFATIASAIISKRFDIVALSNRAQLSRSGNPALFMLFMTWCEKNIYDIRLRVYFYKNVHFKCS